MTTNELIKQLKEIDPDGNTTIAFLHRDEYLSEKPLSISMVDGREFRCNYNDYLDIKPWICKRKVLLIVPFDN